LLARLRAALGLGLAERYTLVARRLSRESGPPSADAIRPARADRDEGITRLRSALAGLPPGDPIRYLINNALGPALYDRYADSWPGVTAPDPADLDEAVAQLMSALEEMDGSGMYSDHDGDFLHQVLGLALLDRAGPGSADGRDDLRASIEHLEMALAGLPSEDPHRVELLVSIAEAAWRRLGGSAARYDEVDAMTSYAAAAWAVLPRGHEDRATIGLYQAAGIHERLRRPGVPFDTAAASRAIDILTSIEPQLVGAPDGHLLAIATLGHFLAARGQANGSRADVHSAGQWLLEAAEVIPADDQWADIRQTLAAGMSVIASLGMDADHVDRAISILADASAREDPDPVRAALTRGTLGVLLVQRAGSSGDRADLDTGIDHLTASYDMAGSGNPYRIGAAANLGGALITRFFERGQVQDADAARFYLTMAGSLTGSPADQVRSLIADVDLMVVANLGILDVIDGILGKPGAFDRAVGNLRAAATSVPPGHPYQDRLRSDLGLALGMRAASAEGRASDLADAARELRAATDALSRNHLLRPFALMRANAMVAAAAIAKSDQHVLRESIRDLSQALAGLPARFGGRFRYTALLGVVAQALYRLSGDRADLDAAISRLEQARSSLGGIPAHPQDASCLMALARGYRARGDGGKSLEAGFAAVRSRGRDLLLQSGTERSLGFARIAASEAAEVATWCLDDAEPAAAVEALEFGRGLILHAATSVAEVADLLSASGHQHLAEEWQAAAAAPVDSPWDKGPADAGYATDIADMLTGGAALEVPDDLRGRVMAALAGSAEEARLLAPPTAADIAAALARIDADTLVYLLPATDNQPGRAVLVPSANHAGLGPQQIMLPELRVEAGSAVRDYVETSAAVLAGVVRAAATSDTSGTGDSAGREGATPAPAEVESLARLCEWAWPAVMLPVLSVTRAWPANRPPRLVLIATGQLSLVPWHAARSGPVGSHGCRYVIEDAVISYAASGRQLVDTARREPLPLSSAPVIVGDPTGDLPSARAEAWAIRERCYPAGRYFGQPGPEWDKPADGSGEPLDVLRQLPSPAGGGASMLHLGCHGIVVGSAPGRSHLLLAGRGELRVDTILRRASGRSPESPGGLITLAACTSDLAIDDYDEALTPATAFLAAGAVTVVAARWEILDQPTSLLMFMFHYLMTAGGQPPRDALRLAQLWMLDPHRTAPPEMPSALARFARAPVLANVVAWAGVVHQGR
jgi:CHAT domain